MRAQSSLQLRGAPAPRGLGRFCDDKRGSAAVDEPSRAAIEAAGPEAKRIAVEEADALKFCCNAVELEGQIILNDASEGLQNRLRSNGFAPVITPLSEFMKAGGAAKCLTLKLVEA